MRKKDAYRDHQISRHRLLWSWEDEPPGKGGRFLYFKTSR